jgi:hypothetical protein
MNVYAIRPIDINALYYQWQVDDDMLWMTQAEIEHDIRTNAKFGFTQAIRDKAWQDTITCQWKNVFDPAKAMKFVPAVTSNLGEHYVTK